MRMGRVEYRPLIAFVHIQKAAGTTLKFILKNSLGVRHSDVNPVAPPPDRPFDATDLAFVRSTNPWLCSISSHEIIEPTLHLGAAALPFTMLRDPVSRSLSHYQDKVVRGRQQITFEQFLSDPANRNFQVRKIAGEEDLDKAVRLLRDRYFFVGLTERFAESIRVLQALCPYPLDIRCRPQNVAADRSISQAVESEPGAIDRLNETNQLDQRLWDYVSGELLPSLAEKARVSRSEPLPSLGPISFPWRFHASRVYHKLVYRPLLKRERRLRAAQT
jgi:hypothetical protein